MRALLRPGVVLLVFSSILMGSAPRAAADPAPKDDKPAPWASNPAFRSLLADETKQLNRILGEALKDGHRRQAVYLARRIVEIAPDDQRAIGVLNTWKPDEFDTPTPKDKFLKKLDKALRKLGTKYFKFGESLEASGMDPLTYYPIAIQARKYGSNAAPLDQSMREAGELWMGTFSHMQISEVKEIVGSAMYDLQFPEAWDDAFLKISVRLPKAKVIQLRHWRVVTDGTAKHALQLLRALDELELFFVDRMRAKVPKKLEPVTIVVFMQGKSYEDSIPAFVPERYREYAQRRSTYYSRRRRLALSCWAHRSNPALAGPGLTQGVASRLLARDFVAKAGGSVRGRGAWFLEGVAGAFEVLVSKDGFTDINPDQSWRLAVARALHESNKLVSWEAFMDYDYKEAQARDLVTLKIKLEGKELELKDVDVVSAQATAFVLGLLEAKPKKHGPKRLAKVIAELYKRDSLPDVDKAAGLKRGRAVEEADRLLDAVPATK